MPGFLKLRADRDAQEEKALRGYPDAVATPVTPVPSTSIAVVATVANYQNDIAEIDAIWRDVQDRVVQLAGGDAGRIRRDLDIAGVLRYLDQVKEKDQAKQARYAWIRDKFSKTLQCISTVGSIVADGASYVFAPAQTCYNALAFVIQAWQGYEGIFENLAELFERCVDFLERLEEYRRWMDPKLRRVACQHLQLFVAICDRSIWLRDRKHAKLVTFTKLLLLNDNGIKNLLSMMDRLVDKEHNLVTAQIFNFTNEIAQNVTALIDGENQRKKEADSKKWKDTLVSALGFEQSMLDHRDKEPIPTWTKTFTNLKNSLIEGTGKWILENPVFDSWARGADSSKPLLVLHGYDGAGKTYMMANVLKYLPKLEGQPRPALAHFFMDSDSKRLESKENMLATVSRSLLWQCATVTEALTKSMAGVCEKVRDFDGTLDLWTQLFFENRDRQKMDTIFYIAIDGLDEEMQTILPLLEKVASIPAGSSKIRVLLTVKTRGLESLASARGISFDSIAISENNNEDVEAYITHRMDSMDILKDITRPEIPAWRDKILVTLRDKTAGDYMRLVSNLDSIAKKDLVEDIEEVLENADKTRIDQIDAEIARLNNTLTVKEISEVNEIILWIITGEEWPSLGEMDAVLALKHGSGSMSTSLLPLDLKLKTKYVLFQVSKSGWVQWKSEETQARIPKKTSDTKDDTSSSGFKEIQEAEVNIVEHFLKQVCPSDLFDKFEFKQFFERKRIARSKNFICQDEENAEVNIALTCLRALTEQRNERTEELKNYAGRYLLTHLKQVDLSLADRELKSQVGLLLIRLFTTEYGIDSLFWIRGDVMSQKTWRSTEYAWMAENRDRWLYTPAGVDELSRWFKDSAVVKGIDDQEGKDFIMAFNAAEANLHELLLKPAAKHLAAHLLRYDGFSMREANTVIFFLLGYMSKIDNVDEHQQVVEDQWATSINDIERIEKWARSVFDGSAVDSLWEAQMAFTISDMCQDTNAEETAQARAQTAMDLDPENWLACHFVASHASDTEEGHRKAVRILEDATGKLESLIENGSSWLEESRSHQTLLAFMNITLGHRYWDLGEDYDKAAETHRKSLKYSQASFQLYTSVFERYRDKERWSAVIDFCNELNRGVEWPQYFDELVNDLLLDTSLQGTLALAADATNSWDVIERMFSQAIDIAIKDDHPDDLFRLRRAFGFTLERSARNEDKVVTVWEAALQGGAPRAAAGEEITKWDLLGVANPLARIYLKKGSDPSLPLEKTNEYAARISSLLQDPDPWSNVVVSCCLARLHCKWGAREEAKKAVADAVAMVLKWLSDDNPSNDADALWYMTRVATTFCDERNTAAVWHARNLIKLQEVQTRKEWEAAQEAKRAAEMAEAAERRAAEEKEAKVDAAAEVVIQVAGPAETVQVVIEETAGPKEEAANTKHEPMEAQQPETEEKATQTAEEPAEPDSNPAEAENGHVGEQDGKSDRGRAGGASTAAGSETGTRARSASQAGSVYTYGDSGPIEPQAGVYCDGCGESWLYLSDVYTCADCVGYVQFDPRCHALLVSGELTKEICDRRHEFVHIPAWDKEKAAVMPKDSVLIGGEVIPFDEWKRELRETYLDGVTPAPVSVPA